MGQTEGTEGTEGVVERFLASLVAHNWAAFGDCLAEEFTRVGPYGDTYSSKGDYVAFLAELMPRLAGYRMEVHRVTYARDEGEEGLGFAELAETVDVDGELLRTPECLVFELTADGLIGRVEVFTQTRAPVE